MGHAKEVGNCYKCGRRIITAMSAKEHIIGDVVRSGAANWKQGQTLAVA